MAATTQQSPMNAFASLMGLWSPKAGPLSPPSTPSNNATGPSSTDGNTQGNNAIMVLPSSSESTTSRPLLLTCIPTDASVDYDENITSLYEHIGNCNWDNATKRCRECPREAFTWVVRYRRDLLGNKVVKEGGTGAGGGGSSAAGYEILWRFLPIRSACALNPPIVFLRTLLQSYPNGSRTLDDQGMLPLHYACGAKCSREVLYLLLMSFPQAALKVDPNGMLPLHYLAQWGPRDGPSESGAVDMVCVATGHKVGTSKDGDGNTPEMLARGATYEGHDEVARKIREFATRYAGSGGDDGEVHLLRTPASKLDKSKEGSPSFKKRNVKNLSVKTSTTRNHHPAAVTPRQITPVDKCSSSEDDDDDDDASELIDDMTLIKHVVEGNIEITLSPTSEDTNAYRKFWSHQIMTPNETKRSMGKLGVSPAYSKQRGGGGGSNILHRKYQWGKMDKSVSWDQGDPAAIESIIENSASFSGSTWTSVFVEASVQLQRHSRSTPHGSRTFASPSLPPKSPYHQMSPRVVPTPKSWRNQKGCQYSSQQQWHVEEREPTHSTLEQKWQDKRLSELREDLSGGTISIRSKSSPTTSGGHLPTVLERNNSGNTNASNGTKLTEQLQALAKEEAKLIQQLQVLAEVEEGQRERRQGHQQETDWEAQSEAAKRQVELEIQKLQAEKVRSENALLEVIARLQTDKDRAEAGLNDITMMVPILSSCGSATGAGNESRADEDDDGVSKLTLLDHEEEDVGKKREETAMSKAKESQADGNLASNSEIERLVKQKAEIELALQRAREEKDASPKTKKGPKKGDEDLLTSRQAVIATETTEAISELVEQVSKQAKQLEEEKAKTRRLEEEIEQSNKSQGDAMYVQLQEVKSLRKSLDKATAEIESHRGKENEWNETEQKLEQEIKDLKEKCTVAQNEENKVWARLKDSETQWNKKREQLEAQIERLEVVTSCGNTSEGAGPPSTPSSAAALRMQLETSTKEADNMRKFNNAIRKEHDETIAQLELELTKERSCKTESLAQVATLQYKISTMEQDLQEAREDAKSAKEEVMDALQLSRSCGSSCDDSTVESELCYLKNKLRRKLGEAEEQRVILEKMKVEFQDREREMKSKERDLDAAADLIRNLEATVAKDAKEMESNQQQIRELKKEINVLQENDLGRSHALWEANRLCEQAIQEKEDEAAATIRQLKKDHEKELIEKELIEKEKEWYVKQLRDTKKKEQSEITNLIQQKDEALKRDVSKLQTVMKRLCEEQKKATEDKMIANELDVQLLQCNSELEQMLRNEKNKDNVLTEKKDALNQISDFDSEINHLVQRVDDELKENEENGFQMQTEIKRLCIEHREATQDKLVANELKSQLLECTKKLKQLHRTHESEVNKLNNLLELQNAKERRLQSHIQSLEKQITDLVNDYESRLQEANLNALY